VTPGLSARLEGIVVRYGNLYGPGASDSTIANLAYCVGAKPPFHVPVWLVAAWRSWRDGFRDGITEPAKHHRAAPTQGVRAS
jgi:hypothetical protein